MRLQYTQAAQMISPSDLTKADQEIFSLLNSYTFIPEDFAKLDNHIKSATLAYGKETGFGNYLYHHQQRTAYGSAEFVSLDFSDDIARKIGHAMTMHDIGKLAQDEVLWPLDQEKKDKSPEVKAARLEHAKLGPVVLEQKMDEIGLKPNRDQAAHIEVINLFQTQHHERADGSGPLGMTANKTSVFVKYAAITDEVDGRFKGGKPENVIFDELAGSIEKYAGKHNPADIRRYQGIFTRNREVLMPQPLAFGFNS